MINLRRYKEVGQLQSSIGLCGYFTVELIHAASGIVTRRLHFKNLLTDVGLDELASKKLLFISEFGYIGVGTDNTTPDETDTSLGTELARTNASGGAGSSTGSIGEGYFGGTMIRLFTTSQANGNLVELGVFDAASSGNMLSRQLILDEASAPTTIVKTSDFELRVTYDLRVSWAAESTYSATVNGAPMNVTTRMSDSTRWEAPGNSTVQGQVAIHSGSIGTERAIAYSGAIGVEGSSPSASLGAATSFTEDAYTPASLQRDCEFEWSSAQGNGTIRAIRIASAAPSPGSTAIRYPYQHEFATPFAKDNTERFVVNIRRTWARV